jgi:transcriptional regulator
MLYNLPAFRIDEAGPLYDRIDESGFASLITAGETEPLISHVPLLLDRAAGQAGRLIGHLARANPQVKGSRPDCLAVAVFLGPDAYVSPGWYEAKREHGKVVPTWNYAVIHVRGRLAWFDDRARLRSLVDRLTARHERRFAQPWSTNDAPPDYIEAQLRAIIGFEIAIETIEGKHKLSQNRSSADQSGVVKGLSAAGVASDLEIAEMMQRNLDQAN